MPTAQLFLEWASVLGIDLGRMVAELVQATQPLAILILGHGVVIIFCHEQLCICIGESDIEQAGILRANGKRLTMPNGMEINEVAQDVSLDGLDESLAAAFQTLEQVGAANTHES